MQGRLIGTAFAELFRLDRSASDPSAGFLLDPDFREPVRVDLDGDGIGERVRAERPAVFVPCQVEPPSFESMQPLSSGRAPRKRLDLVMHFRDLKDIGLVGAMGRVDIGRGDRLGRVLTKGGESLTVFDEPMLVVETRVAGLAFRSHARRGLLFVTFSGRTAEE